MKETIVNLTSSDGIKIKTTITQPSKSTQSAFVLAHGITVDRDEGGFYSKLARLLSYKGILSLRFDFRGHGESACKSSDMTISGEIKDLRAAVNHINDNYCNRVGIIATSFGASIAILLAAKNQTLFKRMALLCPVLDYHRTFLKPETEWAQEYFYPEAIKKWFDNGQLNLSGFMLGSKLADDMRKYHPEKELRSLNMPILIIHGTADSMVPYDVSKSSVLSSNNIKFVPIKGADHGFLGYRERVYDQVITWAKELRED